MLIVRMKIRPAVEADRNAIWNIFREVVAAGDTYALDPNISRKDALAYWFVPGTQTYVAEQPPMGIAGTYILRPYQSGRGRTSPTQDSWFRLALGDRESVAQWRSIA